MHDLISAIDSSILSVDCVEWLNILQQIVQQLFAHLLFILCHNTSRNRRFTFIAIAGKRCSRLVVQTLVLKPALQLIYRSSSNLRLFSASVPAGPLAPADLSTSAEYDVVTDYIIIDCPLRCSSWFSFDVPAGPSSSSSACSWFISFQLIHSAPTGSTWPLPDFEHLT
ncbi:hypothetical protein F511_38160 [Dorcoceras hygrometricum]|uniref:Uncharacterized protein n=1 Tax=Dorcoceras hygrometricum TaxID=472368 RepID=A0A2Z7CVA6_9LAMI|nr:hypothetical protein F511_38160 [Dorcoceras hygrometricum]